jgi:hypothetical protein
MVDSRNKGADYERDTCKKLNEFFAGHGFDITCKRNLDQYQSADQADIKIPYHAIECKAYKDGLVVEARVVEAGQDRLRQ